MATREDSIFVAGMRGLARQVRLVSRDEASRSRIRDEYVRCFNLMELSGPRFVAEGRIDSLLGSQTRSVALFENGSAVDLDPGAERQAGSCEASFRPRCRRPSTPAVDGSVLRRATSGRPPCGT